MTVRPPLLLSTRALVLTTESDLVPRPPAGAIDVLVANAARRAMGRMMRCMRRTSLLNGVPIGQPLYGNDRKNLKAGCERYVDSPRPRHLSRLGIIPSLP